jgi:hypothetical protein
MLSNLPMYMLSFFEIPRGSLKKNRLDFIGKQEKTVSLSRVYYVNQNIKEV